MAAAMMLSSLPGMMVSAATTTFPLTDAGWPAENAYSGTVTAEEKANTFINLTSEKSANGEYSVHFKRQSAAGYLSLVCNLSETIPAGTEFQIRYNKMGGSSVQRVWSGGANTGYMNPPTKDPDVWTYCTREDTDTARDISRIHFYLGSNGECWIDDLEIVMRDSETGGWSTKNLVTNGGFEIPKVEYNICGQLADARWPSTNYSGDGWTDELKAKNILALTDTDAHTGNTALYMKREGVSSVSTVARLVVNLKETIPAGSVINISYWKKGDGSITRYGWDEKYTAYMNTGTTDANGWTYKSRGEENSDKPTVDVSTIYFYLSSEAECLIDDLSIKVGDKEYVNNGSFDIIEEEPIVPELSTTHDYAVWSVPDYFTGDGDAENNFIGLTSSAAHSGAYSMYFKQGNTDTGAVKVRIPLKKAIPNGTSIMVSWWDKVISGDPTMQRYLGGPEGISNNESFAHKADNKDGTGWRYRYRDSVLGTGANDGWGTKTVSETSTTWDCPGGMTFLELYLHSSYIGEILIDDVSVVANGEEYVINSNLEDVIAIDVDDRNRAQAWTENYRNITNKATNYMTVTSETARTGNNSLFSHFETATESNVYIDYRQHIDVEAGKTYVIEAWVKGHLYDSNSIRFRRIEDPDNWYADLNADSAKEIDANGWTRYEAEYTPTASGDCFIGILAESKNIAYIDDMAIYAKDDETKENLFVNGGFEEVQVLERTNFINPICYPVQAGKALNITWKNPYSENISSTKIFVNGAEKTDAVIDLTAEAFNSVLVDGLDNGKEYEIKIVSVVDGEEVECNMTGIPFDSSSTHLLSYIGNYPTSTWKVHKWDYAPNYANFVTALDSEVVASGEYAFSMTANIPDVKSNIYPGLAQELKGLKRNTEYVLTFKYKADGVTAINISNDAQVDGVLLAPDKSVIAPINGDWQTKSVNIVKDGGEIYDFFAPDEDVYDTTLFITSTQMTGTLWIDDVELYEIDFDTNKPTGANLIADGGFEYTDTFVIEEPEYAIEGVDGWENITELMSGKIKVTSRIRNFAAGNGMNTCVVVAVYDGNKLIDVKYSEKAVNETPYALPAEEYSMMVEVPEQYENCEIKVLYWDGIGTMKTLDSFSSLKAAPVSSNE